MSAVASHRRARSLTPPGPDPRALVGLTVIVVGFLVWVLAFSGVFNHLFSPSTFTVTADFQSIEDIVPGDPVRINGVDVGSVASERPLAGGRGARLVLNVDRSAGPIYRNASAAILWRTVLGANDAVALTPGSRAAGELGSAAIPMSHDSNQVELDQITQGALHGGAQSGIRTMLQQLGPAFAAPSAPARDFGLLSSVAPSITVGIGALRGEVPDADLRSLVKNAAAAAQAISVGTGASQTRQFVQSAASTLTALSANEAALGSSIDEASQLMPELQTVAQNTDATLAGLDPLVAKLTPEAPQVAPTLVALHPALHGASALLKQAQPLFAKLKPTVSSLARTANVGVPVINSVSPSLDRLKNTILPGLAEKLPEEGGRPEYDFLGALLVGIGTLGNYFDQDGNTANLTFGLENTTAQQILPCTTDFSHTDLLVCSSLASALSELVTGGTSTLTSILPKAAGTPAAGTFAHLLSTATSSSRLLDSVKGELAKVAPAVAKVLFKSVSGVVR